MKILVAYYSRTGTTKKVAEAFSKLLKCDSEQILDVKSRAGPLGYMKSGKEATLKKLALIKPTKKDPKKYDLVVIGTPVWAFTMSSPIRTYISGNKDLFKKVAFFCTMGGSGGKGTFKDMETLCDKSPIRTMSLKTKEVLDQKYLPSVKEFIKKMK
jgi:flavodoxin